ncbi:MAG: hypothetical protein Q8P90_01450 [bacterium]|nr:hypothetical protein [bacterium]
MLDQLFGSRTRVKLLRLFLTNSQEEFYVRELTRKIGEHINSVRRELLHLEKLGLLVVSDRQRKKYYSVNTNFTLYPELKALILKSRLTLEKRFITKLQEAGRIQHLSLMGYFADDLDSETDVFIIGTLPKKHLNALLEEFNKQFGKELRYTLMSPSEYTYRKDVTDKFLFTLLSNPQMVVVDKLNIAKQ